MPARICESSGKYLVMSELTRTPGIKTPQTAARIRVSASTHLRCLTIRQAAFRIRFPSFQLWI